MPWSGGQAVARAGVTLVELLVVIVILGLLFGVSGLAFVSARGERRSPWALALWQARAAAIRTGRLVRVNLRAPGVGNSTSVPTVVFLPDGRAIGPGADPLTGAPLDAPQ
jgi:prepilin-type N-terminal cleavage/methylation domain-containing protein